MVKNDTPAMEVYCAVREAITKQRLKPGMALRENSLCEDLGVGRSSVRTALQQLAKEGFVELIPNRGAFVAWFSEKQVRELYSLRRMFMVYALEQSIDTYTEEDIQYLQSCLLAQSEAFGVRDLERYVEAVSRFYRFVMYKTGNEYLKELAEQVINRIGVYLCLYDNFYSDSVKKLRTLPFHQKMIDGIREGKLKKTINAHDEICDRMVDAYGHMFMMARKPEN